MIILMDRSDGNENATFSYLIRFNAFTGDVEFLIRGSSANYTKTLILRPYLERWYHVAVVRNNTTFAFYVDGRPVISTAESGSPAVGSAGGSGLAIGGINGSSKLFYGDIIEVASYNSALTVGQVQDRMFRDQSSFPNPTLNGYYK